VDHRPIAVVGDVILDLFTQGTLPRMSAEASVRVFETYNETCMPGGAGNVAKNLVHLGVEVELFAVIGNGYYGAELEHTLQREHIGTLYLASVDDRPTTTKQRLVGPHGQMLCIDRQKRDPIPMPATKAFLEWLKQGSWSAIVVSDYDRGVVTPTLLRGLIAIGRTKEIPILVDARERRLVWYQNHAVGCTLLTPNRNEAGYIVNIQRALQTTEDIAAAAETIAEAVGCSVLLKLDRDGMLLVENRSTTSSLSMVECATTGNLTVEVSGAGDTVIAVIAAEIAKGSSLLDAVKLSSLAAALAVSKPGTAVVSSSELARFLEKMPLEKCVRVRPVLRPTRSEGIFAEESPTTVSGDPEPLN